jgi:hypothetical protein
MGNRPESLMRNRRSRKVDFHFRIVIKFKPRRDEGVMLIFREMHLDMHVLRFKVCEALKWMEPAADRDLVVSCSRSPGSAECNREPAVQLVPIGLS